MNAQEVAEAERWSAEALVSARRAGDRDALDTSLLISAHIALLQAGTLWAHGLALADVSARHSIRGSENLSPPHGSAAQTDPS